MNKTVLFVDHDDGRSGSTVSLEYLVRAFIGRGYRVFVLTPKMEAEAKPLVNSGATMFSLRKWHLDNMALGFHFTTTVSPFSWTGLRTNLNNVVKFVLGILIVRETILKTRPDVVYANEYVIVQASVASYFSGIPAVIHIRSPFLKGVFGMRRRLVSRLILTYNHVVFAITRIESSQLCPRAGEAEKIKVVGEFFSKVDIQSIDKKASRKLLGLPKDRKVVAMLGGIQTIKGTVDFLRAAQIVLSEREDTVFVVAGRDFGDKNTEERAYSELCMRLADSVCVKDAVRILGVVTNPLDLIASSDIVVSTSTETHFSRPVIEAWGFAKPVVAARTDHMLDLITHGVNGLIVDVGDHKALARCLCQLLDSVELRKKLGNEGKKKTDAEFDADKNLQMIVDSCDALISTR